MQQYDAIQRSLSGRMIGHALTMMQSWTRDLDASYTDRLEGIRRNYQYVVDYYLSGQDDPQREEIIGSLVRDCYLLLDDVYLQHRLSERCSYEFIELQRPKQDRGSLQSPCEVFRLFWLGDVAEEERQALLRLAADPSMLDEALMGVSGLTVRLVRQFTLDDVLLLLQLCGEQYEAPLRERAWVGTLLILLHYDDRLRHFPELTEALQDLVATDDGQVFARTALTCVLRSLGTRWAGEAFKDFEATIVPLINKHLQKSEEQGNQIITADKIDEFSNELSEEFKDIVNDKRDALKRIADAKLDTRFDMFKGMYHTAFFSEPAHWWLPYAEEYLPEDCAKAKHIFNVMNGMEMCDSDKYAFVTNLASMGMVNGQPVDDLPEMPEVEEKGEHLLCSHYTQQAYRFFMLNPWQVANPFEKLRFFPQSNLYLLLCPTAGEKQLTADCLLACHAYEEAKNSYAMVAETINTAEVWRLTGYAALKAKDYSLALNALKTAAEMEPTEWTLRQQLVVYRDLKMYDMALELLDRLLQMNPENEAYQYERGKCLEHLELYQEAMQQYYRLELYHPESERVYRSIAWCSFLCDDYETAGRYFDKIETLGKTNATDLLNRGHLLFVQGKRLEALECYKRSLWAQPTLKDFLLLFRPDRRILLEKGIPKSEIYLMEDQLVLVWAGR